MEKSAAPLAITLGDPAGVGPAIVADALAELPETALSHLLLIGPNGAFEAHGKSREYRLCSASDLANSQGHNLRLIDTGDNTEITPGVANHAHASATIKSLDIATDLAQKKSISGIITAPIHKANLYAAGFGFPGHTEYLAHRAGLSAQDVAMMLAGDSLRVIPMTIHMPLSEVPTKLTTDLIIRQVLITHHDLKHRFGIAKPRLVIAGLNPHAGENGSIGHEEATHIQPAIWALEDMGIDVRGPLSADTLFHADARSGYDAALCCYHDQALVPIKTLHFWDGVNVTLGLPYVRTSPDHGTAYDIAAKGTARADSMLAAIKLALRLTHGEACYD